MALVLPQNVAASAVLSPLLSAAEKSPWDYLVLQLIWIGRSAWEICMLLFCYLHTAGLHKERTSLLV